MRVLGLEPFYAGSHRQFLDGWIQRSQHDWTLITLPGTKWKWRMRHAPITFADDVSLRFGKGERWDAIFCSDMLHLGEFLSLAPPQLRDLSSIVYFHENQFTYPSRVTDQRDSHFAFSNYLTALTADQVWFNSRFHHDEFHTAVRSFLKRMPDHRSLTGIENIQRKSSVQYPGVDRVEPDSKSSDRLTILWAARWEHDKNPDEFFLALKKLSEIGVDFRLNVLGQSFDSAPEIFQQMQQELAKHIHRWGYIESRDEYMQTVAESDVIVSTAIHEFFGISVVEAMCSGVYPLLPRRLSYPELVANLPNAGIDHLYDDGELLERLIQLANRPIEFDANDLSTFHWDSRSREMDQTLQWCMD